MNGSGVRGFGRQHVYALLLLSRAQYLIIDERPPLSTASCCIRAKYHLPLRAIEKANPRIEVIFSNLVPRVATLTYGEMRKFQVEVLGWDTEILGRF